METSEATMIRNFIMESCDLPQLDDDSDIFGTGVANSLFAIQLMTFVESEFSVRITTDDLKLSNFCSVNAIERFLERKRA